MPHFRATMSGDAPDEADDALNAAHYMGSWPPSPWPRIAAIAVIGMSVAGLIWLAVRWWV